MGLGPQQMGIRTTLLLLVGKLKSNSLPVPPSPASVWTNFSPLFS